MQSSLLHPLQALAQWRSRMEKTASELARWLEQQGLCGDVEMLQLMALRERLSTDRLKLAFVADNPGTWALQSLIAERVDAGLLTSFTVS